MAKGPNDVGYLQERMQQQLELYKNPETNTLLAGKFSTMGIDALNKIAKETSPIGLKFDTNKVRMDLLDPEWLEGVAQILTFGASKYAAHNWRKGIPTSRLYAGIQRHLSAFQRGERIDVESGHPHLWHASCGLMFLSWMVQNKPDLDDLWKPS